MKATRRCKNNKYITSKPRALHPHPIWRTYELMWTLMHQNTKPRASVRKNLHPLKKHLHLRQEFFSLAYNANMVPLQLQRSPTQKQWWQKSNSISLLTDIECVFLCKRKERACGCWVVTSKPDVVQIVECWVASTINKQFNKHFSSLAVCWMFQPNEENLGRNSKDRSYLLQSF